MGKLDRLTHAAAIAAALSLAGCTDVKTTLYIVSCLREAQDTCEAHADLDAEQRTAGQLDVGLANHYYGKLGVVSQLIGLGDPLEPTTETARVSVQWLDVELLDAAGTPLERADGSRFTFTAPTSGFVDPGDVGIIGATLLDEATTRELGQHIIERGAPEDVVVSVVARGRTLGGDDVESDPWRFPIHLCRGCLVVFPPDADDPNRPGVDCDLRDEAPPGTCRLGMDEPVDCRSCSESELCQP